MTGTTLPVPNETSRRSLLQIGAGGVLATALVAAGAENALAYQGNMERAISQLYGALASLREATPDKGGHKAKAAQLVLQAIAETQAGIEYAAEKFGD